MQAEMGTFGPRLKQLLDEVGMTQNELERRAKLSKGAVSNYISERREQPRRDTLQKMADALNVPLSRLVADPPYESSELPRRGPTEGQGGPSGGNYAERQRAILMLGPHLEDDRGRRVRNVLLSLSGPPYDQWETSDWLAEAERIWSAVAELDDRWSGKRPAVDAEPERKAGPGKASALVQRDSHAVAFPRWKYVALGFDNVPAVKRPRATFPSG